MIALVDCNNFYASCERVFNPLIHNKPIVVLSNNDGCVIARSNQAKNIGIKMGVPAFKYQHVFDKFNVQIFSTNFALYGDFSNRIMSILASIVPRIEIYLIDEAFIDYSGFKNPIEHACILRNRIKKWTGITVSIGIGRTKTLAKVANAVAKKEVSSGVYHLSCSYDIHKRFKNFPVYKLWGIGKNYANQLKLYNINTAYDLINCTDRWVHKTLSVSVLNIVKELRGISCFELETNWKRKQSIRTSRTFGKEITSFAKLAEVLSTYATMCAYKLREQNSCANTIIVFIRTNSYSNKTVYYEGIKNIKLDTATNDSMKIVSCVILALRSIYRKDCIYKKAGVIVSDIIPQSSIQLSFFDNINDVKKRSNLMNAMDKINKNYGKMKVRLAINGYNQKLILKQERLSPCYTTQISELIQIQT